ncbi:peptidase C14 caspase catalytic subunit p20 [Calothrix sp. NIES-4071]|nr:peptidase C14 caspase catalytic subunit p20 [Calothrix sp. NIES-4071]BAZ54433.1 peptidase C14 caspase catalytic subunit p20 [Calothrix sp. NIES-4105]
MGGAIGERIKYFTLSYDSKDSNWIINGGILHGIRPISEGETSLAIFPQGSTPEELSEIDNAICKAELLKVGTEKSIVKITDDSIQLSQKEAYWAIVTDVPVPKLKVYFQGDSQGVERVRTELSTSLFVQITDSSNESDYYLEAVKGQYWIVQPADKQPLVAPVPEVPDTQDYTQKNAQKIVRRLEHIARWKNILELKTPPTSQIQAGDVEMEVIVTSGNKQSSSKTETSALRGVYTFQNNESEPPAVKIKLTNNTDKDVYFQVIELAGSYKIDVPDFFVERSSIYLPKKSGDSENIKESEELYLEIPSNYLNQGVIEYDTIFKLIVSTREFNASLLEQPGLDEPPPIRRDTGLSGTLNRLMDKVYTRETRVKTDKYIDNWMTQEVKISLVKPPNGVEIKKSGSTTLLTGVNLQEHSTFEGKFSFSPLPPSSRNVNSNSIPAILLQDPKIAQPYQFNLTRSPMGVLSVLEIADVQNYESVAPDNPLKLIVNATLAANEHILPIADDGEFILPLGKAKTVNGKTEITIERLPEPTINSRSLQGSIKILFYKLSSQLLGTNFNYPLLRIASVNSDGFVSYNNNQERIREAVSRANKILLYIHGIIGDTKSLLPSVTNAKFTENGLEKSLKDKYDLVLAFDYENLNTTIEENATQLGQKLEEVGLTANHGKQLHIVAHSMGGLVSRIFIEKKGGASVVQHLVMLGTPNAGSPWSKVQDWAFLTLGIGLNQLFNVAAWPVSIIAALLIILEANDNTLDQMRTQSTFITGIANNIDPGVQYTIIAGDRSILKSALEVDSGKKSSQIQRLIQKLFTSAVDGVVDKVFWQQANDIAVTLESIHSISQDRSPKPIILPNAACDHLTYFTSEAGLNALVQALWH